MSNTTDNDPIQTIDITGNNEDLRILKLLDEYRKQHKEIRETAYIKDFAALRSIESRDTDPECVIPNMLTTYMRNVSDVSKRPNLLNVYCFVSNHDTFKYFNNMLFRDDITIICFLHFAKISLMNTESNVISILIKLIENKYRIEINEEIKNLDNTNGKLELIAECYRSVLWSMKINMTGYTNISNTFFDVIPKQIHIFRFANALPIRKPPYAILILSRIRVLEYIGLEPENISLYEIFNEINNTIKVKEFLQRLNLELCLKWKIVEKGKFMYQYSACFEEYRQRAKDLIAEIKPNDPDLELVLSRL